MKRKRTQKAAQMSIMTVDTLQTTAIDFTSYTATPLDVQMKALKVLGAILQYTGDSLGAELRTEIDKVR